MEKFIFWSRGRGPGVRRNEARPTPNAIRQFVVAAMGVRSRDEVRGPQDHDRYHGRRGRVGGGDQTGTVPAAVKKGELLWLSKLNRNHAICS